MAVFNQDSWQRTNRSTPMGATLPSAETPTTADGRRFKVLLLCLACVPIMAAMVVVLSQLAIPHAGALVVLVAEPTGCDRLAVPYDPVGALTGRALLANPTAPDRYATSLISVEPIPLKNLEGWAAAVAASKADPLVVYVGAPSGLDATGAPVLWTGALDPPTVPLQRVLKSLGDAVGRRQVLVVLDTNRSTPNLNAGEVNLPFTQAVIDTQLDTLAKYPTISLMLPSQKGELAWEFPAEGLTLLGRELRASLWRTANSGEVSSFSVADLFAEVQSRVVDESTRLGRVQKPYLMGAAANTTRGGKRFLRPVNPVVWPVRTPTTIAPEVLKSEWAAAESLRAQPIPPYVYNPMKWRVYLELLMRLERAAIVDDAKSMEQLAASLAKLRAELSAGLGVTFASAQQSFAMPVALGLAPEEFNDWQTKLIDARTPAERQSVAAAMTAKQQPLPSELLFARSLERVPGPARSAVSMIRLRIAAERAALGADPKLVASEFAYSEAVWPTIEADLRKGDTARRRAEDAFAANDPDESVEAQNARTAYDRALAKARLMRNGLAIVHQVRAETPFYAQWLADMPDDLTEVRENLIAMLQICTQLETALAKVPVAPDTDDLTQKLKTRLQQLQVFFLQVLHDQIVRRAVATERSRVEALLRVPRSITMKTDHELLWQIAATLSSGGDQGPVFPTNAPAMTAARRLAILEPFAPGLFDEKDREACETENVAGKAKLQQKWRDSLGQPSTAASSRVLPPMGPLPDREPANVLALQRWRALMTALAERAQADQWASEPPAPDAALLFRRDAETLATLVPRGANEPPLPSPPAAAANFRLQPIGRTAEESLIFTTDRSRVVGVNLTTTAPGALSGRPTVWWTLTTPTNSGLTLETDQSAPKLLELSGPTAELKATLLLAPATTDFAPPGPPSQLVAQMFYRGQTLRLSSPIVVDRQPERIVRDLQPSGDAYISLHATPDLDPGTLMVVLDDLQSGRKNPRYSEFVKQLLLKVPANTRLIVRVGSGQMLQSKKWRETLEEKTGLLDTYFNPDKTAGGADDVVELLDTARAKLADERGRKSMVVVTQARKLTGTPTPADIRKAFGTLDLVASVVAVGADSGSENRLRKLFAKEPDQADAPVQFLAIGTENMSPANFAALTTRLSTRVVLVPQMSGSPRALNLNPANTPPALMQWSGPFPPGQYTLRGVGTTPQPLTLAPGARLTLRLVPEPNNATVERLEREPALGTDANATDDRNPEWSGAVPWYGTVHDSGGQGFSLNVGAVCQRKGTTLNADPFTTARPAKGVWWNLTPRDPSAPPLPRPLRIYQNPTAAGPLWSIRSGQTNNPDRNFHAGGYDLRGWVLGTLEELVGSPREATFEELMRGTRFVRDGVDVDARMEPLKLDAEGQPSAREQMFLVVRLTNINGRRLMVDAVEFPKPLPPLREHRYYADRTPEATLYATTVLFGPLADPSLTPTATLRLQLLGLNTPLAANPPTVAFALPQPAPISARNIRAAQAVPQP